MTVTSQREVSHRAYPVLPCWCLFTVFTLLCFLIYWEKKWKQFVSLDPRFGDFRCVPPDWTLFLDIDIYFWNFPLAFAISISFGVLSLSLVWDLIKKKKFGSLGACHFYIFMSFLGFLLFLTSGFMWSKLRVLGESCITNALVGRAPEW